MIQFTNPSKEYTIKMQSYENVEGDSSYVACIEIALTDYLEKSLEEVTLILKVLEQYRKNQIEINRIRDNFKGFNPVV